MGHIAESPVSHIWHFKGIPQGLDPWCESRALRHLLAAYVVIDPEGLPRAQVHHDRAWIPWTLAWVWLWIARCQDGCRSYPRPLETSRSWKEIAELKRRVKNSYWTKTCQSYPSFGCFRRFSQVWEQAWMDDSQHPSSYSTRSSSNVAVGWWLFCLHLTWMTYTAVINRNKLFGSFAWVERTRYHRSKWEAVPKKRLTLWLTMVVVCPITGPGAVHLNHWSHAQQTRRFRQTCSANVLTSQDVPLRWSNT